MTGTETLLSRLLQNPSAPARGAIIELLANDAVAIVVRTLPNPTQLLSSKTTSETWETIAKQSLLELPGAVAHQDVLSAAQAKLTKAIASWRRAWSE